MLRQVLGLQHVFRPRVILGLYYAVPHFSSLASHSAPHHTHTPIIVTSPASPKTPYNALASLGLEPSVIENTLSNKKVTDSLLNLIETGNIDTCDKRTGNLIYALATKATPSLESKRAVLLAYIMKGKIKDQQQLDRAFIYLKDNRGEIDLEKFEEAVGINHSPMPEETIHSTVDSFIASNAQEISTKCNHRIFINGCLKKLRDLMPTAPQNKIFEIFSARIASFRSQRSKSSEKNEGKAKAGMPAVEKDEDSKKSFKTLWGEKMHSFKTRDLNHAYNSPAIQAEVARKTGGKVITRFPPEPNGYLHLGHAKAIRVNFMSASVMNGECYLRYDDSNPEKESSEYIASIEDNVRWLGFTPNKVTHASEYFEKTYELAKELITKGKAYICEQTKAEMNEARKAGLASPCRERSITGSLRIFEEMKAGKHPEGKYCLRAKIDHTSENPTLRDPVIYRVKYTPHPHTGAKWCIYPTYDFTHCINDSIENVTYSLCTLEFEVRRDLYYWILDALDLYKPFVWEYSRLNISYNVLSKRKLTKLVEAKVVSGWDDPRLLTINGLRRRGYTPAAINEFCDIVSVTRRGNENVIAINVLEGCIRRDLDRNAPRSMAVLKPLRVVITNVPDDFSQEFDVALLPKDQSKGKRKVKLTKEIFIESDDFRADPQQCSGFYGLSIGKSAILKYTNHVVNCVGMTRDVTPAGEMTTVFVELQQNAASDPQNKDIKGVLHFLAASEAKRAEIRLYDHLFNVENPNELEDIMTGINKNSLQVLKSALVHKDLAKTSVGDKFQFERNGFFCVDQDTKEDQLVFNRIVSLYDKDRRRALSM